MITMNKKDKDKLDYVYYVAAAQVTGGVIALAVYLIITIIKAFAQ
jgi:hypothetical protein